MPERTEPLIGRNFQVVIEIRGPRGGLREQRELACSRVLIPPLRLDDRPPPITDDTPFPGGPAQGGASPVRNLVLQRGHTGSSALFELWKAARDRESEQVRDVLVTLLGENHKPVTAWHFAGCHVVGLSYSPLDALDVGVLSESLELSFKSVEQVEA